MTELMVIPEEKPQLLQLFVEAKDLTSELDKIREKAKDLPIDMNVKKSRDEVASFAYKIARAKSAVEKAGAALSAEYKEIPKKIDAARRAYKNAFDFLQAEIRQPLTEWEQRESDRKAAHERAIDKINLRINEHHQLDASETKVNIQWLENDVVINDSWEEYELEAGRSKDHALTVLREHLVSVEAREAEQAELERLRQEAAEREQAEREERIAREAAEKARQEQAEALAKAQAEKEMAEQRRIAAEKQAELDKIEAEKRAIAQAEAAKQAEIDRQAAEAKRIEDERLAREADANHKGAINRQALADLVEYANITEEQAKLVIKCIVKRLIANVTINY